MAKMNYPPGSVIACLDGSSYTQVVLDAAIWAAQCCKASLGLLHAHDDIVSDTVPHDYSGSIGFGSSDQLLHRLAKVDAERASLVKEHGQALLSEAGRYIEQHADSPLDVFTLHRHEQLKDSIQNLQSNSRLIVLGQHGSDSAGSHDHIGSQLETAIRSAHVPALVVKEGFSRPKSALYAFDNRSSTINGLEWLQDNPLFIDQTIHVVMVANQTSENLQALDHAASVLSSTHDQVTTALISGKAKEVLPDYLRQHHLDALIMGAYSHSRLREFFVGSTTHELLQHQQRSTLLLRF